MIDWTRTQREACPECGFDPAAVADPALGRALTDSAADWGALLAAHDAALLRIRPRPEVWAAVEYACHVRDVLGIFEERIRRTLTEHEPTLGWWDHEAAVDDDEYRSHDVVLLAEAIAANARTLARTMAPLDDAALERGAVRRPGETFTARGMARFALHESVHHHRDAMMGLDDLGGPTMRA